MRKSKPDTSLANKTRHFNLLTTDFSSRRRARRRIHSRQTARAQPDNEACLVNCPENRDRGQNRKLSEGVFLQFAPSLSRASTRQDGLTRISCRSACCK